MRTKRMIVLCCVLVVFSCGCSTHYTGGPGFVLDDSRMPEGEQMDQLPQDMKIWWHSYQASLLTSIDGITDEAVDQLNAKIPIYDELTGADISYTGKPADPQKVRNELRSFVAYELEQYLATLMTLFEKRDREKIKSRMKGLVDGRVLLSWSEGMGGYVSGDGRTSIHFNPTLFDTYANARHTLAHEFTHSLIQHITGHYEEMYYFHEAMTEYIVIATFSKLGWKIGDIPAGYIEEIKAGTIMVCLMDYFPFWWYVSEDQGDTWLYLGFQSALKDIGIHPNTTDMIWMSWKERSYKEASISAIRHQIAEIQSVVSSLRAELRHISEDADELISTKIRVLEVTKVWTNEKAVENILINRSDTSSNKVKERSTYMEETDEILRYVFLDDPLPDDLSRYQCAWIEGFTSPITTRSEIIQLKEAHTQALLIISNDHLAYLEEIEQSSKRARKLNTKLVHLLENIDHDNSIYDDLLDVLDSVDHDIEPSLQKVPIALRNLVIEDL